VVFTAISLCPSYPDLAHLALLSCKCMRDLIKFR
jgi:hypothetical protein